MGVTAVRAIDPLNYPHQYQMTTIMIAGAAGTGIPLDTEAYCLLIAAERDIFLDSVFIRAAAYGSDGTVTLRDVHAGEQGDAVTAAQALTADIDIDTLVDGTTNELALIEVTTVLTEPRTIRVGGALYADFTNITGLLGVAFYIRWRDHATS